MSVKDGVAGVTQPGECRAADADGGRQLRDFAGRNLKAICFNFYAAEVELIDEGIRLGEKGRWLVEVLSPAHAGFELGCDVGGHVEGVGVAAGEVEGKVASTFKMRNLKQKINLLLEQSIGGLKG